MRHAMVVHFPIVLSVVGIPTAVAAALIQDKTKAMRWTALVLYLVLTLSAWMGGRSGHGAHDAVYGSLSDEAQRLLEEHGQLGTTVWLFGAAVAVLVGVSFARKRTVQLSASWLAVVVAVAAAGWTANTADHGGRLVYEHGAGAGGGGAVVLSANPTAGHVEDARITYFRHTIPYLLAENCLGCHNPRGDKLPGGLDLTTIAGWLAGGKSGPAVVPGRPDESLVMDAVRGTDPDLVMPPGDGEKLSAEQIAALERWIAEGLVWEQFEFQLPDD